MKCMTNTIDNPLNWTSLLESNKYVRVTVLFSKTQSCNCWSLCLPHISLWPSIMLYARVTSEKNGACGQVTNQKAVSQEVLQIIPHNITLIEIKRSNSVVLQNTNACVCSQKKITHSLFWLRGFLSCISKLSLLFHQINIHFQIIKHISKWFRFSDLIFCFIFTSQTHPWAYYIRCVDFLDHSCRIFPFLY